METIKRGIYFLKRFKKNFRKNYCNGVAHNIRRQIYHHLSYDEQSMSNPDYHYWGKSITPYMIHRIDIKIRFGTLKVTIFSSRPGIVIGRKGENWKELRKVLVGHMEARKLPYKLKLGIEEFDPFYEY